MFESTKILKREKAREKSRKYRAENREKVNTRYRLYRQKNKDKIREIDKRKYEKNKEAILKREHKEPNRWKRFLRSKKNKHEVLITEKEFNTLQNTTKCFYCGCEFSKNRYNLLSLDRKDNTKGYLLENIIVCCFLCNMIKNGFFTYEEMIYLGERVAEIRKNKLPSSENA